VKETYQDHYRRLDPASYQSLAKALLKAAVASKESPPYRFALLYQACDAAAQAGDRELALQMVDELAKRFRINPLQEKATVLERAARAPKEAAPAPKELAQTVLGLADEALAAEDYDTAARLLAVAVGVAKKARNKSVAATAQKRWDNARRLKGQYDKLEGARQKLAADPKDPAAALAVGRFYCFHKGDWRQGLPLLALAKDSPLPALAKKDLDRPVDAPAQIALAEAWWTHGKNAKGAAEAEAARRRAHHWFREALPELMEAERIRVEGQMKLLARELPGLRAP
jgi:hypothetical protein